MKRRSFLVKAGSLLINAPILLTSCKKLIPLPSVSKSPQAPLLARSRRPYVAPAPPPPPSKPQAEKDLKIPDITNNAIIDGYLDKQSYLPGETALVYLSAKSTYDNHYLNCYNLDGSYAFYILLDNVYKQTVQADAPYENGYGYKDPITFAIPLLKSGVYLIGHEIPIIIRNPSANVDFTIVYSSNTEHAYNSAGGKCLYDNNPTAGVKRSGIVSFLRPVIRTFFAAGIFEWLLTQPYRYNVISDMDMDDPMNFKGNLLIITGHNEYWTKQARINFDAYINSGSNALVLSGNTMYYQARYDATKTQLICYKEPDKDPTPDILDKTVLWSDTYLHYSQLSSLGVSGLKGGLGIQCPQSWKGLKIQDPNLPIFKNTNLQKGDIIDCNTHEYDGAPLAGYNSDGFPIIDNSVLRFNKVKLIGYDYSEDYINPTITNTATALMFQKRASSGIVINIASTNWCTREYFFSNESHIPQITNNCISMLLNNEDVFGTI